MTLDRDAFDLTGRVALVTGAAQGIGAAIAQTFARFGATLVLCDRESDGLAGVVGSLDGSGHTSHVLDVRDDDALATMFASIDEGHGRLDVAVNNAGGGFAAPFVDVSPKGELALIHENFTSAAHVIRSSVARMPAPGAAGTRTGGGSIINVTSIEAHRAAPNYATYSAMKAGLANLTKTLALELGPAHIRINTIAPDVIPTPGIGGTPPVTTPLPYAGHVDDIAAAALYLAGDASRFVTGTTIHVDGGNLAAGGWRRSPDGTYTT